VHSTNGLGLALFTADLHCNAAICWAPGRHRDPHAGGRPSVPSPCLSLMPSDMPRPCAVCAKSVVAMGQNLVHGRLLIQAQHVQGQAPATCQGTQYILGQHGGPAPVLQPPCGCPCAMLPVSVVEGTAFATLGCSLCGCTNANAVAHTCATAMWLRYRLALSAAQGPLWCVCNESIRSRPVNCLNCSTPTCMPHIL
jgi:hypothetical protein